MATTGTIIRPHTCQTCKHMRKHFDQGQEINQCRKDPPQVAVIGIPGPRGVQIMAHTQFPVVNLDWDCDWFKPKVEQ